MTEKKEVPAYEITDEMKQFGAQYTQKKNIADMLKRRFLDVLGVGSVLRQLVFGAESDLNQLVAQQPDANMNNLWGQGQEGDGQTGEQIYEISPNSSSSNDGSNDVSTAEQDLNTWFRKAGADAPDQKRQLIINYLQQGLEQGQNPRNTGLMGLFGGGKQAQKETENDAFEIAKKVAAARGVFK